jgi:predicted transcriptional regulator
MTKRANEESADRLVAAEVIERRILTIRGHKVMLDAELAALYGVTTKRLNEQVKRNRDRFPPDFMFQRSLEEGKRVFASRSQTATLKRGSNIKYAPNVFTEHGAVMLASVLNSQIAIEASIQVVRAFVRLRNILATHHELGQKLDALERKYEKHGQQFKTVFTALRQLLVKPTPALRPQIGFRPASKKR